MTIVFRCPRRSSGHDGPRRITCNRKLMGVFLPILLSSILPIGEQARRGQALPKMYQHVAFDLSATFYSFEIRKAKIRGGIRNHRNESDIGNTGIGLAFEKTPSPWCLGWPRKINPWRTPTAIRVCRSPRYAYIAPAGMLAPLRGGRPKRNELPIIGKAARAPPAKTLSIVEMSVRTSLIPK